MIKILAGNLIYFYFCSVFFIVLDLRLTKVGVQRCSVFFALLCGMFHSLIQSLDLNQSIE